MATAPAPARRLACVTDQPIRVSVILPAYRLAASIGENIRRVVASLEAVEAFEVIVVDDGSEDGTREAAQWAAGDDGRVTVIGYPTNAGKGHAIRTGFGTSKGATVVFLDGDLDLPPEQVPALLQMHRDMGVAALVGAKRQSMRAGGYPLARRFLSVVFSLAIRLAFRLPVSETQTGLKVFLREPLERFLPGLRVTRYSYDIELLSKMHRAGYLIAETPVAIRRQGSTSSVSLGTLWEMARDTCGVWYRDRFRHD